MEAKGKAVKRCGILVRNKSEEIILTGEMCDECMNISFINGKKEGIKEVVDWGKETCPHSTGITHHYKRVCDTCWQDRRD